MTSNTHNFFNYKYLHKQNKHETNLDLIGFLQASMSFDPIMQFWNLGIQSNLLNH